MTNEEIIEEIAKILNWETDGKECSMRPFTVDAEFKWLGILYEKCNKIDAVIKSKQQGGEK